MTLIVPSLGRIVHYKLASWDVTDIYRRRADAEAAGRRNDGAQVHVGNAVIEGQTFPAMIVRVWGEDEKALVNLQVFLDGNDVLWAMSRAQGEDVAQWQWSGADGWA